MNVLILDARMSKRMGSPVPKVVLSPAGCSMLGPVLDGAVGLSQFTSGVVKGNGAENVMVRCEGCMDVAFVLQSGQLGTGNLLREALPEIDPSDPHMLVCFEDVLLLDRTMFERKAEISFDKALDIVKKKKIIYAPDATMQAMLSDKKGRVLIIEPGIGSLLDLSAMQNG